MADLVKLGQLLDGTEQRDAIHVAIAPVVATEKIFPGQEIGVDGKPGAANVGIVDPFLKVPVMPGERCYLWLFPNTVTGMRHHWEHPAFSEGTPEVASEPMSPVDESRKWIETFAASIEQTYNALMRAAKEYLEYDEYTYDNSESYKQNWDGFAEFWKHYEIVTGETVPETDYTRCPFTCSC